MSTTRSGWKAIVTGLMVGLLAASSASGHVEAISPASPSGDAPPASVLRVIRTSQGVEQRIPLADGRRLSLAADGTALTLWDVVQKRVIRTHRLPVARINASLTLLPSGRVLLWGGATARGEIQADGFWFDPELKTLEPASDLRLLPRAGHTATVLTDGRVLFAGGRSRVQAAELWDERSNRSIRVPMKTADVRSGRRAELQSDGRVRLWGGATAARASATADLVFDPASNQFANETISARVTTSMVSGLAGSLPAQGTQTVAPDARLSLRFGQPMRMADLNVANTVLVGPGGATAVRVTPVENGRLVFVTPTQALFPDSRYTLMVDGVRTQTGERVPLITVDFKTVALDRPDSPKESPDPSSTDSARAVRASTGENSRIALRCVQSAASFSPCRQHGRLKDGVWSPGKDNTHNRWRIYGPSKSASSDAALTALAAMTHVTTIRGRVVRVDQKPVAGVEVSLGSNAARTDAQGFFMLVGVPSGRQELYVDGSTANSANAEYGQFVVSTKVVAGKLNEIPYLMHLPRITARDKLRIDSPLRTDLIVEHPDIPGLELRIPKGTVIHDRKGRLVTELAIVPTPVNRAPFPVMENHPMAFTVEPGGAQIRGLTSGSQNGIRIYYPNYDGYPAGTQANFWIYGPSEGWRVYGKGTVSADGRHVVPEAGVALHQTMGGMYSVPSNDPPTEPDRPPEHEDCKCKGKGGGGGSTEGDPIDLKTGNFSYDETDAVINDVAPLVLGRSYRPHDLKTREFGIGTAASFGYYLHNPDNTYDSLSLVLPNGSFIPFARSTGTGPTGEWRQSGSMTAYSGAVLKTITDSDPAQPYNRAYLLTMRDGSRMQFASYGDTRLRWMEDKYGNRLTLVYDAGLVSKIISPSARSISLQYDSSNRISAVTDHTGRMWKYAYNGDGLLARVTYPDQTYRGYVYKTSMNGQMLYRHAVESITDQRGHRLLLNELEVLPPGNFLTGRVLKQTQADGGVFTFEYDHIDGNTIGTLVTKPDGSKRRVVFDPNTPYPASDTVGYGTPLAQTFRFERNAGSSLITARIDPLTRRTEYSYDGAGRVTQMKMLAGTAKVRTASFTYNADGDLSTVKDPLSRVTTLTYVNRCLTSIKDPLGHSTRISCNSAGQPVSVTDANNNSTVLTYLGYDLAAISDPLNRTVQIRYDTLGRPIAMQDAEGNVSRREYDAMGRVKKSYDAHGRVTEMGYDANGNVTAVLLPNGNGITYTYDTRDRVTDRTDSLSQQETWTYDLLDRVKTYTDRKGQATTTDYDVLGRPTLTTYPGTAGSVTATYDAGDRLRTLVDTISGTLGWDYDDFDQVLQTTTPQGSVGYTYDAVNRRRSMTAGSQAAVTYDYDNADLLRKIQQGSEIVTMDYDPGNRPTLQTLPNGIKTAYTYNAASQLTGLGWAKADGSLLGDLGYGYSSVGRQVAQTGSFASQNLPAASTGTNSFDDSNRQTQYNGQALTYDANGNLTFDGIRTYVWNAKDQLIQVKQGSTVLTSYAYDALGRRITRAEGGATTAYLYDDLDAVQETQGSATYPSLTGLGIDQRFARTEGSGRTYFLSDGLGSTKALTNASGTILNRYDYSPYGETSQTASGFANPYQYTGREKDANGLYYYRARYYHPGMGRFISEDPIGLAGGLNTYAYVGGNPISLIDPLGLWSISVSGYVPIFGVFGPGGGVVLSAEGTTWQSFHPKSLSFRGGVGAGGGFSLDPAGTPPDKKACSGDNGIGLYAEAGGAIGPIGGGFGWNYGGTQHIDANGRPSWNEYGGIGPQSDFGLRAYEGAKLSAGAGVELTHYF